MALYHKYRPQTFSELVGQDHVKTILVEALAQNRASHAYLFAGPRGLGKTTTARLLAKALNCTGKKGLVCNVCQSCLDITYGKSIDVIEIDAASHRGIDEIRELREKIKFSPTSSRYKVFIVDEVHMLTKEAFNALLKTLEEPPAHAVFVLATTEPHKLPATIISRAQRFDFKRPTDRVVSRWLKKIAEAEKIFIEDAALERLAQLADGSFRDAINLLDQVTAPGKTISLKDLESALGLPSQEILEQLVKAVDCCDTALFLSTVGEFYDSGGDVSLLYEHLIIALRKKIIIEGKTSYAPLIRELIDASLQSKLSPLPQLPLELALIEWCGAAAAAQQSTINNQQSTNQPEPKNQLVGEPVTISGIDAGQWNQVVEAVKAHNHSLAGILTEGKVAGITADKLRLLVKFSFHKDRIEDPKNHRQIAKALSSILGRQVTVVCELDSTLDLKNFDEGIAAAAKDLFGVREEIL